MLPALLEEFMLPIQFIWNGIEMYKNKIYSYIEIIYQKSNQQINGPKL